MLAGTIGCSVRRHETPLSPRTPWSYRALRPLLFALDAERAHRITGKAARIEERRDDLNKG